MKLAVLLVMMVCVAMAMQVDAAWIYKKEAEVAEERGFTGREAEERGPTGHDFRKDTEAERDTRWCKAIFSITQIILHIFAVQEKDNFVCNIKSLCKLE